MDVQKRHPPTSSQSTSGPFPPHNNDQKNVRQGRGGSGRVGGQEGPISPQRGLSTAEGALSAERKALSLEEQTDSREPGR